MSSLAEESETLVPPDKLSVGDLGEGIKMVTQNTETGDGDGEETKDGKEKGKLTVLPASDVWTRNLHFDRNCCYTEVDFGLIYVFTFILIF